MTYIHATADTIIKYPFSRADLSSTFPNVSFPPSPTADDLAPFNIYPVATTPRPADTRDDRTIEGTPTLTDSGWQQTWSTRPATEAEQAAWDIAHAPEPQWMDFALEMAVSPSIAALYNALPAPVASGLSIGLNDAAKGDDRTFLRLWQRIATDGAIAPELLDQIIAAATSCHLPASFIQALQPPIAA